MEFRYIDQIQFCYNFSNFGIRKKIFNQLGSLSSICIYCYIFFSIKIINFGTRPNFMHLFNNSMFRTKGVSLICWVFEFGWGIDLFFWWCLANFWCCLDEEDEYGEKEKTYAFVLKFQRFISLHWVALKIICHFFS